MDHVSLISYLLSIIVMTPTIRSKKTESTNNNSVRLHNGLLRNRIQHKRKVYLYGLLVLNMVEIPLVGRRRDRTRPYLFLTYLGTSPHPPSSTKVRNVFLLSLRIHVHSLNGGDVFRCAIGIPLSRTLWARAEMLGVEGRHG